MKPLLFLAADYANITGDGKLNVMGIFNDVNADSFPARHPSMFLIAKLAPELSEYGQQRDYTIILMDADANHILELSGKFQVPRPQNGRKPEVNIIFDLKDIVFTKAGRHVFIIQVDKDQKDEFTLYVNQIISPNASQE